MGKIIPIEDVSAGSIWLNDKLVNDVSPSKRGVAMVFQSYALYPHMTTFGNMSFGLRQLRIAKDEINKRVREAAKTLALTDFLDRMPGELSGGQRQKVAIGRAIVREPELFLFDEPLSNLDAALRVQTRLEIARLHEKLGATMIYVTHDQVEAMTLADKIVVLRDGQVEQVGKPVTLYETPANEFVAGFIGSPKMNFFAPQHLQNLNLDTGVSLGIRPEHLEICKREACIVKGRLELAEHLGEYILAHIAGEHHCQFVVKVAADAELEKGKELYFRSHERYYH